MNRTTKFLPFSLQFIVLLLLLLPSFQLVLAQSSSTPDSFGQANSCWPIHSTQTNSTGPNVYAVQYLVRNQGQSLSVDGIYGTTTKAKVTNVQSANGLSADGIVGPNTWQNALIVTASKARGSSGDVVRAIQHLLKHKFGYDLGTFGPNGDGVDGDFGQKSDDAVRAFQRAKGLGDDGIVGPLTWSALVCLGSSPPPNTPTNTPLPVPTKTPTRIPTSIPTNTPQNPPPANQVVYPSGAAFNKIAPGAVADGRDYSDPVAGGVVPLIDLNGRVSEKLHTHFAAGEFQTNDGARYARIAPDLVSGLQKIRNVLGSALNVNSGYRHPAYNSSVGGASQSRHMTGQAADIGSSAVSNLRLAEIALQEMGCNIGIGLYGGHIHVDVRGTLSSWVGSGSSLSERDFDQWVADRCAGAPTPTNTPVPPQPTQPPPPPSGLCWPLHSTETNSIGHNVYAIQHLLKQQGLALDVDGIYGPNTKARVMEAQRARNFEPDGVVGPLTWENGLVTAINSESNGDAVRALQYLLRYKHGYDLGTFGPNGDGVDGDFGSKTAEAAVAFQQRAGLTANGTIDAKTWSALVCDPSAPPPPTTEPPPPPPVGGNGDHVAISQAQGFDACGAPTLSTLQTWRNSSPYQYLGIYIGGENSACRRHNSRLLTANYISDATQLGWGFLPVWVGPQANGSICRGCSKLSCNEATARDEGIAEARKAVNAAHAMGLTNEDKGGTILYYDMEAHNASCREAVKSFIDGWVEEVHASGNQAGVYGSSSGSYMTDFASVANVPDAIWYANWLTPARYRDSVSLFGIRNLPDNFWANQQRIRQYAGDHDERYGGITINIDSNAADGPIATSRYAAGINRAGAASEGKAQSSAPLMMEEPKLEGLDLLSEDLGWVLIDQRLYLTKDSGGSWVDITPPMDADMQIESVNFPQGGVHGWVAGRNGMEIAIYRTRNGGQSWTEQPVTALENEDASLQIASLSLQFFGAQQGWLSIKLSTGPNFSEGMLFGTTDGGTTWSQLTLPIGEAAHFVDEQNGWVAGGPMGDQLYRTVDGGNSWQPVEVVSPDAMNERVRYGLPSFDNKKDGTLPVTLVDDGKVTLVAYITADGGGTWRLADSGPAPQGLAAANRLSIGTISWAVNLDKAVDGAVRDAVIVDFITEDVAWAYANNRTCDNGTCQTTSQLFKTTDEGQNWQRIRLPTDPDVDESEEIFLPLVTK